MRETMACDVLVLGGGLSGCFAAIAAARKGQQVILVEKGAVERSGAAGTGFDHWESACTNPCSRVTPEEIAWAYVHEQDGYSNGILHYIECREGYDRQVVVLTQPAGYRKRPAAGLPVIRFLLRRYPKAAEAMAERHRMYNRQMDELDRREADGRALVLRPPEPLAIGHTEKRPGELERVYHIGVREAERRIREIQAFLTVGGTGVPPA